MLPFRPSEDIYYVFINSRITKTLKQLKITMLYINLQSASIKVTEYGVMYKIIPIIYKS